jgi:hypothetical protein
LSRQPNIPYLNLHLSQRLLDLTGKERLLRVRRILAQIIDSHPEPLLAVDNIELLFEPGLQQEPLALLQELSRNKSLVVAWGGDYGKQKRVLTYAEPGHPEYRRYERPEVVVDLFVGQRIYHQTHRYHSGYVLNQMLTLLAAPTVFVPPKTRGAGPSRLRKNQ